MTARTNPSAEKVTTRVRRVLIAEPSHRGGGPCKMNDLSFTSSARCTGAGSASASAAAPEERPAVHDEHLVALVVDERPAPVRGPTLRTRLRRRRLEHSHLGVE